MDKKEQQEATMRFTSQYLHDLRQQDALVDKIADRVTRRLAPLIEQMIDSRRQSEPTTDPQEEK